MISVLEHILNDPDYPGDDDGKRVHLQMKWGQPLVGHLRRGLSENSYAVRTMMEAPQQEQAQNQHIRSAKPAGVLVDVYFDGSDVAMLVAPVPERKIVAANLFDISKMKLT